MQWFVKNYGREETLDNSIKVTKEGLPLPPTQKKDKHDKSKTDTKNKKATGNRRYDRAKEMLQNDNQLHECISLISSLHSAQTHTPQLVKTRADALTYLKQNHISADKLDIEEVKL